MIHILLSFICNLLNSDSGWSCTVFFDQIMTKSYFCARILFYCFIVILKYLTRPGIMMYKILSSEIRLDQIKSDRNYHVELLTKHVKAL